jgi:hypothetical protein
MAKRGWQNDSKLQPPNAKGDRYFTTSDPRGKLSRRLRNAENDGGYVNPLVQKKDTTSGSPDEKNSIMSWIIAEAENTGSLSVEVIEYLKLSIKPDRSSIETQRMLTLANKFGKQKFMSGQMKEVAEQFMQESKGIEWKEMKRPDKMGYNIFVATKGKFL